MSRAAHKVDVKRTAKMRYRDPRSYRTISGQEFLFGDDKSKRRREIYERDGGMCFACGRQTSFADGEWEHRTPLSKGGDDSKRNGRWSCHRCNQRRHGRYPRVPR